MWLIKSSKIFGDFLFYYFLKNLIGSKIKFSHLCQSKYWYHFASYIGQIFKTNIKKLRYYNIFTFSWLNIKCNNITQTYYIEMLWKIWKQSISLINPTFNKVMGHFPTFQFETNLILILPKLVCTVIIIRIL